MKPVNNLDSYSDLREDDSKKAAKKKEAWAKVFRIVIKIFKWPFIFIVIPLLAFFIPYLILGQGQNIGDAFKDNTILFLSMIALVLGAIAAGVIGAIITKKYLSATGLSALTYIITFFVLSSYYKRVKLPYVNEELAVSFDSMMLIIVTALVVFVFIGDLIVFVFRLLKEKRQEIKS